MNIQSPQSQTVSATLADLLKSGNETDLRPYRVLIGHNMGFNTLLLCIPIDKFYDISEVANEQNIQDKGAYKGEGVAQRELDPKHAEGLATYLLKGLFASVEAKANINQRVLPETFFEMQETLGTQPYLALQPITANIRNCEPGGGGLRVEQSTDGAVTVYLAPKHVLWIIDGQHRREAMRIVFEFLKEVTTTLKYPRRAIYPGGDSGSPVSPAEIQVWNNILEAWRSGCTVMSEVHLGLDAQQERQLFHDLNNLTKKVAASLAFVFDNANPINVFIKEQLIEKEGALFKDKVTEKENSSWIDDKGTITRKDLITVNSLLLLNKNNARNVSPATVAYNKDYALKFWAAIGQIPNFGSLQARMKTVAAQPVVLKSLAKLAYTFGLGRSSDDRLLGMLIDGIPAIDYSHTNPMWRFSRLTDDEQQKYCPDLKNYLSVGFVEVGTFDDMQQIFRFSPLHSDIMPSICDMIRWSLKLPSRFESRNEEGVYITESSRLTVEIDYPAIGKGVAVETFAEAQASDTMRKIFESIATVMGEDTIQKITRMREGRRALITNNPEQDLRIGNTDKLYANQRIGRTRFFVNTNTDTPQKVKDLREVAAFLGFSSEQFRVYLKKPHM